MIPDLGGYLDFPPKPSVKPGIQRGQRMAQSLQFPCSRLLRQTCHQDNHHHHQQVIERQVSVPDSACQLKKHFHSGFQCKQKESHPPRHGFVVQQQAKPPPKPQPVEQQGGGDADTQMQPH